MAEEVDLNFLGGQMRRLQSDVRELKADVRDLKTRAARTGADVLALDEQLATMNDRFAALEQRVDGGFDEVGRELSVVRSQLADIRPEMTRNLEIVLTAIREQRG